MNRIKTRKRAKLDLLAKKILGGFTILIEVFVIVAAFIWIGFFDMNEAIGSLIAIQALAVILLTAENLGAEMKGEA